MSRVSDEEDYCVLEVDVNSSKLYVTPFSAVPLLFLLFTCK
jgi:hypothetical protein